MPKGGIIEPMGVPAEKLRHAITDYYRIENDAATKHEFWDGRILARFSASPGHAKIAANISACLWNRLRGKRCQPYTSDLRIRVVGQQRTVYPDISIICGEIEKDPNDRSGNTVLNPRLVVEVVSPSTEAYDRGNKFAAYRLIPSLSEYVLVSQLEPRVETFLRQDDGTWSLASYTGVEATAKMRSIGVEIPLEEIFAGITFEPPVYPLDEKHLE